MDNPVYTENHRNNIDKGERIPTLEDLKRDNDRAQANAEEGKTTTDVVKFRSMRKENYVLYKNFGYRDDLSRRNAVKKEYSLYSYCFISVVISFVLGLVIGIILMGSTQSRTLNPKLNSRRLMQISDPKQITTRSLNSLKFNAINDKTEDFENRKGKRSKFKNRFDAVSFTGKSEPYKYNKDVYPKSLTEDMKDILKDTKEIHHKHTVMSAVDNKTTFVPNDETVLYNNVFWGPEIENAMPQGYGESTADIWERYVNQSEVVKMETGCGRMQNRLVTFKDGIQACVRYRQNTDQIQGEIFSFYVAKLLNLTNLAPSVVRVVDVKDKLWKNVANDIASALWNTNRAVVLTQYIPSLESATIPDVFKPSNRHLNKNDVLEISLKESVKKEVSKEILIEKLKVKNFKAKKEVAENFDHIDLKLNKKTVDLFVELAQWSDLIIFDYLTANLDRIVNNLFNFQWNVNIMDGPAHNLARKMDSGLLLFLDNESGLLHGYRLLKKYNVYHSLMLDNLCVFRRTTIDALKKLYELQTVGSKLSEMFHSRNSAVIRDILPPLPEKNAKILYERIGKVLSQLEKCENKFSNR